MEKITITPADIKKYKIAFTDSGQVIDELAYSAGEATNSDIYEYDEGEPYEPYMYNYEADLFKATKNEDALYNMARTLEISLNANIGKVSKKAKLQAGAWLALNDSDTWEKLLNTYTEALHDGRTDGMSDTYNKELQNTIDEYYAHENKEWLYGDHSNYAGVIYLVGKYYGHNPRSCSYDSVKDIYTLIIDEEIAENDISEYDGTKYSIKAYKEYLLNNIKGNSEAREYKNKQEREKAKAERARLLDYKAEQKAEADKERKEKLLAMKI